MPRNGKTSVFRVTGLSSRQIVALGSRYLRTPRPLAEGHFLAGSARASDLDFEANNEPERHANIIGWPETKEAQKRVALRLVRYVQVEVYR